MDGRRFLAVSIGWLLSVTAATAQVPDDPLADVERLYASAAFEDALAALERVSGHVDANQIDEYRALCFLGLNRPRDAEKAVERLVMRNGSSTFDLDSRPPKFANLYRAVQEAHVAGRCYCALWLGTGQLRGGAVRQGLGPVQGPSRHAVGPRDCGGEIGRPERCWRMASRG